jgi:tetratricopeptide (TPR) repeat protein
VSDKRWRLQVSVDDSEQDRSVWADRFDVEAEELFDAQDELAARVVGECFPTLVASEVWRARRSRARTLSAWSRAHRALWHVERRSPDENARAHELLDGLREDGAFLPAMHARGLALFQDILNGWCADIEDRRARVHAEAERAVGLWAEAPAGHMLRARARMSVGDWEGALPHIEVATAINPSLAEGHALAGQLLAMTGRCNEGLARMQRARRLSPNAYVAAITIALFAARRYEEARALAEKVLEERPQYVFPRIVVIAACMALADVEAARAHGQRLLEHYPTFRTQEMSRIYAHHDFAVGDQVMDALHAVGIPR